MSSERYSRRTVTAGAAAMILGSAAADAKKDKQKLSNDPLEWTLCQASSALADGRISSVELTTLSLNRIDKTESSLNAFITVTRDTALSQAKICDSERKARKRVGRLHGVPLALKDNIDTAGVRTTAASRVFEHRVPNEDAEIVSRLKNEGAIFLGKLNLDEFAFEGTGTTSFTGPVHNPWALDRITGGSSAGSAAAVSALCCYGSVGSDDGGSVRIPASYCGVVGLKTSYGRVSTRGVIPSAYSLDTVGPICRTVEDAAAMLQVLAGYDERDSITADVAAPNYSSALGKSIRTLRIGIPRDYFFERLHPDVERCVNEALVLLRSQMREVRDVTLPRFQFVKNGDYNVELYHYQKQFFDKTPELYHPWSRQQLNDLKNVETVAYIETLKRIRDCRRDIRRVFENVDVLVLPTMREPAPVISEIVNRIHRRLPSNVSAFNRFGLPAITIPCGFSRDRLPIGLQIVGKAFDEATVLAVAYSYQEAAGWKAARPAIG